MARKRKQLPLLENVVIADVAAEGKAIAKVDGMAVFVPYAVPGDVVDIQLTRKKNSFAEGKVVKFHSFSDLKLNHIHRRSLFHRNIHSHLHIHSGQNQHSIINPKSM